MKRGSLLEERWVLLGEEASRLDRLLDRQDEPSFDLDRMPFRFDRRAFDLDDLEGPSSRSAFSRGRTSFAPGESSEGDDDLPPSLYLVTTPQS